MLARSSGYVGLDVSLEKMSILNLDQSGTVVFEGTASSRPESIAKVLNGLRRTFERDRFVSQLALA
jgi:hypothetical protein